MQMFDNTPSTENFPKLYPHCVLIQENMVLSITYMLAPEVPV